MTGNVAGMIDAKPVLKHSVLQHFLLEVLVCLAVETLGDNALEHEHRIYRPAAGTAQLRARFASALDAVGINGFEDLSPVGLKREQFIKSQQLSSAFFGSLKEKIACKKIVLGGRLAVYSAHNGFSGVFVGHIQF